MFESTPSINSTIAKINMSKWQISIFYITKLSQMNAKMRKYPSSKKWRSVQMQYQIIPLEIGSIVDREVFQKGAMWPALIFNTTPSERFW